MPRLQAKQVPDDYLRLFLSRTVTKSVDAATAEVKRLLAPHLQHVKDSAHPGPS